jgi:penicillin-binding protein 1A
MTEQKEKKTKKKTEPKKALKVLKVFTLTILFLILTAGVTLGGYLYAIIKSTPQLDVNAVLSLNQPSVLFDNKGNKMDNVITEEQRFVVSFDTMPDNLKNAFISIEDERFYQHKGVDPKRLLGVIYVNIKNKLTGKTSLQGASTLTQQLLKNTILTNDVTIERKVKEIYLALNLEKSLNKNQILEAYLNTIPLGGHQYGVEATSLKYFGKSVKGLNLIQCAYIAGITQAPSYYDAFSAAAKKNPSRYLNRTKTVIEKMLDNGYITKEQYDKAIADLNNGELEKTFNTVKQTEKLNFEWFSRPVIEEVIADLKEKYKYTDEEARKLAINGGLKIYTTMDRELQINTQNVLNDRSNFKIGNKEEYDKDGVPLLQASATIMDYRTGEVKAMVGGRGNQTGTINRAYTDLRSIGSATKPLTVYAPAIEMKLVNPGTTFSDTPTTYNIDGQTWTPKNQHNANRGQLTVREALRYSSNVIAVRVADKLGVNNALAYGEKFGLIYSKNSKYLPALALGQFYNGSGKDRDGGNTFIMAAAYGTFGNDGIYTKPILYTKVIDATGKEILTGNAKKTKVISPETAYVMYDLLKEPVENYSAKPAKFGAIPVAGKTGTTTDNKDLWFAGLTPYLSAAVWVGYDTPRTMTNMYGSDSSSGEVSGSLWGKIMAKAHEGLSYKEIEAPNGLVKVVICADSGKLPTDLCRKDPRGSRLVEDYVVDGSQPTALCDLHVLVKINKSNGKLANANTPPNLIEERVFLRNQVPTQEDDTKPTPTEPDTTNKDTTQPPGTTENTEGDTNVNENNGTNNNSTVNGNTTNTNTTEKNNNNNNSNNKKQ